MTNNTPTQEPVSEEAQINNIVQESIKEWAPLFTEQQLQAIIHIYTALVSIKFSLDSTDEVSFRNSLFIDSALSLLIAKDVFTEEDLRTKVQEGAKLASDQIQQQLQVSKDSVTESNI